MANRELSAEDIGAELGTEGVGSVVSKVEAYCAHEERRIALTNEPRIVALQAQASWLLDEERDLVDRVRLAPPTGDLRGRRRKAFYYVCVTAFLTLAAFIFSLYSFEPFRLGLKAYLYCLGIAVLTPFLVEQAIERWKIEGLIKSLTTIASSAALLSLVLLAVVRGDLMAEQIKDANPVVTFDDSPQQPNQQPNNFYERTMPLLQLVMALLALAMELGAGLALHEAWRMGSDSKEDWQKFHKKLAEVRERLAAIAFEITALQREPQVFASRFWRNFYRAMLVDTMRSAGTKLLVALAALVFLIHGYATAQSRTNIVVALDLTQSEDVRDPNGKTEFQKNVGAVTRLLGECPADAHLTIVGITDESFSRPDILLSASIPADTGYFGERLAAARRELVRVWIARSAKLNSNHRRTDIFGVLELAEQIFSQQTASHKILAIFSDMRESTTEFDFESASSQTRFEAEANAKQIPKVKLRDVEVYVYGANSADRPMPYWQNLQKFWADFFKMSGAALKNYSLLRTHAPLM